MEIIIKKMEIYVKTVTTKIEENIIIAHSLEMIAIKKMKVVNSVNKTNKNKKEKKSC